MRYAGGKGKIYQRIINLIPPHNVYVESHLGGGAVMQHIRPAKFQIGIDKDQRVCDAWTRRAAASVRVVCGDAAEVLPTLGLDSESVVYVDPPYMPCTRRRARVYRHDYSTADHERLLGVLLALPAKILISGYANSLYADALKSWRVLSFSAMSHIGLRQETVWANFSPPAQLHDSRYIGNTFREREAIRRRHLSLRRKINQLPLQERHAFLSWLEEDLVAERTSR